MLREGETTVECLKKGNQRVVVSKECSMCNFFNHIVVMKMTLVVSCDYGHIPDDKSQIKTEVASATQ